MNVIRIVLHDEAPFERRLRRKEDITTDSDDLQYGARSRRRIESSRSKLRESSVQLPSLHTSLRADPARTQYLGKSPRPHQFPFHETRIRSHRVER
jgi:hypothetical protein